MPRHTNATVTNAYRRERNAARKWPHVLLAFGCAISLTLLVTSYLQTSLGVKALDDLRTQSHQLDTLDRLQLQLLNAETGVRGYLLSGERNFLEPYEKAHTQIDATVAGLRAEFKHFDAVDLAELTTLVHDQQMAMAAAIAAHEQGQEPADLTASKATMDEIRTQLARLRHQVAEQGHDIIDKSTGRFRLSQTVGVALAAVTLVLLIVLFATLQRQFALRERISRLLASENERLDEQVRRRTIELRELARLITNAREEEKARLAHELHDEMGALLTAAKMDAGWIARKLPDEVRSAFQSRLERLQKMLTEGIALKRRIIDDLRPPLLAELGLIEALRALGQDLETTPDMKVEIELPDTLEIGSERALALFRIAQEAVTNIRKYAHATQVHLRLKADGETVRLTIADNGEGFDPAAVAANRHGLAGMRHRVLTYGGELTVRSSPGQGTAISARLPVD